MKEWQKFPAIFLILLIVQSAIFLAASGLGVIDISLIPFVILSCAVTSLVAGLAIYLMISSTKRMTKIALGIGILIILWLIVYVVYLFFQ